MVKCLVCGVEFKCQKYRAIGNTYCSKNCTNKGKETAAYERMCKLVGGNFNDWLAREYTGNQRPIRDISRQLYGSEKCSSSVLKWLKRAGIESRDRSEAVKLQWVNNDERRKQQGEFIKRKITGKIRDKIIETMQSDEYKEKQRVTKTGERNGMYGVIKENSSQWNPDRTDEQRIKDRKLYEYKQWRGEVFLRDGFACQVCGNKTKSNLVAHHHEPYLTNETARFDVDNGVTLCRKCHVEYHSVYGRRFITREKFEQFVKDRESITA
jgi:5-methylcytosine-specific restriction endonuclease McrA